jgi:hypothetical protein
MADKGAFSRTNETRSRFAGNSIQPIDSISVASLRFCKINHAAIFLRKSPGNATFLRNQEESVQCFGNYQYHATVSSENSISGTSLSCLEQDWVHS